LRHPRAAARAAGPAAGRAVGRAGCAGRRLAEKQRVGEYLGDGIQRVWPARDPKCQQRHRPRHRQQRVPAQWRAAQARPAQ
nr:hypothetical protein [Tanacetum cinerariifolium]